MAGLQLRKEQAVQDRALGVEEDAGDNTPREHLPAKQDRDQ